MTKSTWIKTILGIILSISLAFYVNQFLHSIRDEVEVVVAAQDIMAETVITEDMVSKLKVNAADQALLVPNAAKDLDAVIGSVAVNKINKGEVIVDNPEQLLAAKQQGSGNNLKPDEDVRKSYFIPAEMRAITVSVDAEGGLAFGLKKGDMVDVIFTSSKSETGGIYSSIILEKVEVFDIEELADKDKQGSTTLQNITLLVTPKEAQNLALAKRKGDIDLVLNPINPNKMYMPTGPSYPYEFTYQKGVR